MSINKIIIFGFALLLLAGSTSFAASSSKTSAYTESGSMYQPFQDPLLNYVKVNPGFKFSLKTSVSTGTAKVLSLGSGGSMDGAVVCPGTLSMSSNANAQFAAPNFYSYDLWWETCTPSSSSATPTYNSITWSKSNYNTLKDWNLCYDTNPLCWGKEGSFVNRKVDFYEDAANTVYANRAGSAAATCYGTTTLSISGGTFSGEGTKDVTSSGSISRPSINLASVGTYTISDRFNVKGCAVTIRHPKCGSIPQAENIYSRTVPQLGPGASEYSKNCWYKLIHSKS